MHSMLLAVIIGTVFMFSWAQAQETWIVNGKPGSKVDGVKALLHDPGAEVVRCVPQELTPKLTLKAKKK